MQVEYTSPWENEPIESEDDAGRTAGPARHHADIPADIQVPQWKSWSSLAEDATDEVPPESADPAVEIQSTEGDESSAQPRQSAIIKSDVARAPGAPYEQRPLLTPGGPTARTPRLAGDQIQDALQAGPRADNEIDAPDRLTGDGYDSAKSHSYDEIADVDTDYGENRTLGGQLPLEPPVTPPHEESSDISFATEEFEPWSGEDFNPWANGDLEAAAGVDLDAPSDVGLSAAADIYPDAENDAILDAGEDVDRDAAADFDPDAGEDVDRDAAADFDPDATADAGLESAADIYLDAASDGDLDSASDEGVDLLTGDGFELTSAHDFDEEIEGATTEFDESRPAENEFAPGTAPAPAPWELPEEEYDPATDNWEQHASSGRLELDSMWDDRENEVEWADAATDNEVEWADAATDEEEVPPPSSGVRHDWYGSETVAFGDDVDGSDAFYADEIGSGTEAHRRHTVPPAEEAADANSSDEYSILNMQDRVVIMLLFKQLLQIEDVENVWHRWHVQGGDHAKEPLWRFMTRDPSFDRELIFSEAAQVYAFPEATFDEASALSFLKRFKDSVEASLFERMRELRVIPVRHERKTNSKQWRILYVSHDPTRPEVNRLLRELKRESYEMQYAPEAVIEDLLAKAFPARNEYLERVSDNEMAYDLGTSYDQEETFIDEDALEAEIGRSTLINLFEATLVEAVRRDVSDIHIFPNPRKQVEIHFRVNGELECWHREERIHPEAFLAVVKDNTLNVDRFERDAAQDGFIQRKIDDTLIRFRVSVLPVANANQELRSESIVIRVLDDRKVITDLSKLGLLESARAKFEWAISQPHGMVILTGPTGSGKTTTLFAALCQVVTPKLNVLTVEDPVEYVIPGVRQVKLSHKLNLEQALRSILRHDPDVVMVGEMRDRQTADLAIKLANTGHLTFSTLHTNDAPSAISRLYKMGVEPFLIAYAINLVVAQRLVRVLCRKCKKPLEHFDAAMLERLGFTVEDLTRARFFNEGHNPNCKDCGGSGYKGRRAITETMPFSNEIRRQIVLAQNMIDEDTIRRQAESEGMLSLRASAREVVIQGETSVAELIRITAGEH